MMPRCGADGVNGHATAARRLAHHAGAMCSSSCRTSGGGGGRRGPGGSSSSSSVGSARWPLIVGHRGLLLTAPENTPAGFAACASLRVGFEFDVDRSADGVLVCVHDTTVDRTTDATGPVSSLTLAELQRLDAGSWFDESFRGERIPTIAEVLSHAQGAPAGGLLACDIKIEGAEEELVGMCDACGLLGRVLFIGRAIHEPAVRSALRVAAHARGARAHVGCLASHSSELAAALADAHSDWAYLRFMPTAADVARCREAGKCVFLVGARAAADRGVSEAEAWRLAAHAGVDAFLTDWPLELPKEPAVQSADGVRRST
eukprot:COSAG01_NODE_757_length_13812_cov_11.540582_12_plen_317_part_00